MCGIPKAACPCDIDVRQEWGAAWKPTAVADCDYVVEGTRQQHRGRAAHSSSPGAVLMGRGGPGGRRVWRCGFRMDLVGNGCLLGGGTDVSLVYSVGWRLTLGLWVHLRGVSLNLSLVWRCSWSMWEGLRWRLGLSLCFWGRRKSIERPLLDIWRGGALCRDTLGCTLLAPNRSWLSGLQYRVSWTKKIPLF